jgi:ubiquinone/menaquinone biosynthesis C-methylase UbiE
VHTQTPPARPPRPSPPRLLGFLFSQFGCPRGWLGRLAGASMSRNSADDAWTVDSLDVQPSDRVLEVGFGPGVAIGLLAARARDGLVAGIDPSAEMLHAAITRNRPAVSAGRVELRQASISSLPYEDASFDKACALHSTYFWPSLEHGLEELHRVLVPGGRLAIAVRMRNEQASTFNPARYGMTDDDIADITSALTATAFTNVTTQSQEFGRQMAGRETITVIVATRGPLGPLPGTACAL